MGVVEVVTLDVLDVLVVTDTKDKMRNTLSIHLTEKCNLRCSYCYLDAFDTREDQLENLDIQKVIDKIQPTQLFFYGGEPLLKKSRIESLISKYKNLPYTILTNGTLISDRDFYLQDPRCSLILSMDHHEYLINSTGRNVTEKQHKRILHWILKYKHKVSVAITIHNKLCDLSTYFKWLDDNKISYVPNFTFNIDDISFVGSPLQQDINTDPSVAKKLLIKKSPFNPNRKTRLHSNGNINKHYLKNEPIEESPEYLILTKCSLCPSLNYCDLARDFGYMHSYLSNKYPIQLQELCNRIIYIHSKMEGPCV